MGEKTSTKVYRSQVGGSVVGGDMNITNIIMLQDSEREFVVTHNADIKPVSYFTGRETELQELRQRIEEGRKPVLVSGMGGIGKTHICRKLFEEYTNKHADGEDIPFCHIGYIKYDGDMNTSLQRCLKFKKQERQEDNLEAAWRELEYLASDGELLLFVDNVNKPISADSGLQILKGIPGAVVLTSRRTSFSKEFEPYRIGILSTEQCIAIYEKIRYGDSGKKVPEEEAQDLEYVIDILAAGHTITIEFLAHLAETKCWTAKELREELANKGFCLEYKDEEDKLINIQEEYEKLYDLSKLTEAEKNILEAFSVFPYIPLEAEICNQWLLKDVGASEEDDVLIGLYRKGWLQFNMEWKSYSLHPVFAQFIYEKCKPKAERHYGLMEGCQKCLKIPDSGSAMECQKFIPFAESIVKKMDMEKDIDHISFISSIAYLLYYTAEYRQAETLYKKVLRINEKVLGGKHPSTASSYNNLAEVYESQGKYEEAEELYKKALQISEGVLGWQHPDTATSYNNLAGIYYKQGNYGEAEGLYRKALQIRESVLGEEHPSTASSYNNLAYVYARQGEYQKAEELFEKSLRIRERMLGEEHPSTATSYHNLAGLYDRQGEYQKAKELYEKALRIRQKVLGEEHPETAANYNNLAGLYLRQGEYQKAGELFEKSLHIRERVLGEEHPSTVTCNNNLAAMYAGQREYRKAEEIYKKILRIYEQLLGKGHVNTAFVYNNLACVYKNQGEYKTALTYYQKAYKILLFRRGLNHPKSTQIIYDNMKSAYFEWKPEGNFEQWLEEKMKEPDVD